MGKPVFEQVVTPKGAASWPALKTPDEYEGKKSWIANILVDPAADETVQPFLEKIEKLVHAEYKKGLKELKAELADATPKKAKKIKAAMESATAHIPFAIDEDDEGNPTGLVLLKVKCGAEYKNKAGEVKPIRITLVDSQNKKLDPVPEIGGGSILRCSAHIVPFNMIAATGLVGVSLRLNGVQVLSVENGAASIESLGFGVEEGGFQAADADTFSNDDDDDDEDDGDY